MQAAAEGLEPLIEIMADGLIGKQLFELLHILLVSDRLEQVPKLIVKLRQPPDFFADVVDGFSQIGIFVALECAVCGQRLVQLSEQPS